MISLSEKIFWCLAKHSVDVIRSELSWGSKPPTLQVGAFNFGMHIEGFWSLYWIVVTKRYLMHVFQVFHFYDILLEV